jgi:23S rRNA (guanosine2251-2'-O)-methyltransferase
MTIFGIHSVAEALRADTVSQVWVSNRRDRRLKQLMEQAERGGIDVRCVDRAELDRLAHGGAHQGVVARLAQLRQYGLAELMEAASGAALIVVVDGVEDPQNFGAIVRTADAVGVDGVVYQTRRAAPTSAAAMRASAGAMAHVRLAPVVNIARTIEELKSLGVWSVGLDASAPMRYHEVDLDQPLALVLGAEGKGLRRLVRERCDWLVSLPMCGQVSSLNVSVAAGVVLYEAIRRRG